MTIRDATAADLPAILAILNDVLVSSAAIWRDDPETPAERATWFAERTRRGFPVLVAVDDDDGVLGFASYGDFRALSGYRTTVEHSIHIRSDRRGGGLGTVLLDALVERARAAGIHVMVAGVDGGNAGSLRFHVARGFQEVARMPQVGRKYGRWVDLVLLQRLLD
ncbi:MAG TPA: GNAT family N-acetyltransferase [Candidatus Binatia bacterium]|nr:GNAT family N-acetyltransferase [Candidatus Binatia bacterium]